MEKNYKNYLPSKKFIRLIIGCVVAGLIIFLISNLFFGKNKYASEKNSLVNNKTTINDLLQKDSDGDGVMDWEEALWGTDPNNQKSTGEISDSEYIKQKRAELNLSDENLVAKSNDELNETEKFSREFFASIIAMQQEGGDFDQNAINNVSNALGQKIVNPTLIDSYSEKDIKLNKIDNADEQETYYYDTGTLFESYREKGIGDELETASAIAGSGTPGVESESSKKLIEIADAYQEFAQKTTTIPVPESLVNYHIKIINGANNTGIAVRNMAKMGTDPIVGISGLSQYQKYSEDFVNAVTDMETFLSVNDIISL